MTEFVRAAEQPITTDIKIADEVFMKTMRVAKAGTIIPQHAHTYAHVSVLVRGAVRVFRTDNCQHANFEAPAGITIPANVKHLFTTLVDDTIVLCVHDVAESDGEVSIAEEHHIVGAT